MKSSLSLFVLALVALSTTHASISYADGRPPRTTHEGDTGPGPTPSTPGSDGGSGSWSHPDRPSRDVDHDGTSVDTSIDFGSGGYSDGASGDVFVACAPADVQSNVVTTDKTLATLAKAQEFATATKFKTAISQIAAMKQPSARAAAYLSLAGIKASDKQAVFDFVGAREAKGSWIVELERRADLNEQQAVSVATALQSAIRGGLN